MTNEHTDVNVSGAVSLLSRRTSLLMLGAALAPVIAGRAWAQTPQASAATAKPLPLPLRLERICGHIGVSVPDVGKAALFYSKVFGGNNVTGEKEPFLRYMVDLSGGTSALGAGGGVAIGKLGTLGSTGKTVPLIDHFCFNAVPFDDASWQARLKAEGLMYMAQGVFMDIDAIAVQIAGAQGGENLAAGAIVKMEPLYTGEALVRPLGYEHIMLHVADLQRSVAFYKRMFGLQESARKGGVVYFSDGQSRLALQQVAPNEAPNIHHYAVKVPPFDRRRLASSLTMLGARLLPTSTESRHAIRFADPDGLVVELWPT